MAKSVRYRFTLWATVGMDDSGAPDWTHTEITKHLQAVLDKRAEPDCEIEFVSEEEVEE